MFSHRADSLKVGKCITSGAVTVTLGSEQPFSGARISPLAIITTSDVIELRAYGKDCALSDCEHAKHAKLRIAAVIDWLARPRLVPPHASGTSRCVRAQRGAGDTG